MAEDDLNTLRPRQSNFFKAIGRDPEINSVARDRIVARAVAGELELSELRHKLVSRSQQESINGLRIEGQRFAVDEARRVAQRRRDEVAEAGLVADSIRGVLDDGTLSDEEKQERVKRLEFEHRSSNPGGITTRGPNTIFSSAKAIVGEAPTRSERRLEEQAEKSNEYRRLTLEASNNKLRFDAFTATHKSDTEFFNGEAKFIEGLEFGEAPDTEDRFGEDVETDAFEDKASLNRVSTFVKEYHDFDPETAGQYEHATSDREKRAIALKLAATVRANLSQKRRQLNEARSGTIPTTKSKAATAAGVPTK
jgi:hypothetical protein